VIAYFHTSALVPLLVEEAGSVNASRLWDEADRVAGVRLTYVEGRAALAAAGRAGRLRGPTLAEAVERLEDLCRQTRVVIEVGDGLVRRAGQLAEEHGLRGYDAVHLAAAETLRDEEIVLVAGDNALCRAAEAVGLPVART
jgi:predicted nucleic acid-binding protein